jgi:segregation and condensation protein A
MEETSQGLLVQRPAFEGPLDLLLHLIKVNEVDIYDIPIALITAQYLEYLDLMQELNLDIASEYLVMAATLAYIKSRLLLPSQTDLSEEKTGEDPRDELVRRLLEYQKFKQAAEQLGSKEILGRDVFARSAHEEIEEGEGGEDIEASLFDLMEALREILKKVETQEKLLDFTREKISLKDKMIEILEKLRDAEHILFEDLFSGYITRFEIIVTFVALLELIKNQKIRALQVQAFGSIRIYRRGEVSTPEGGI